MKHIGHRGRTPSCTRRRMRYDCRMTYKPNPANLGAFIQQSTDAAEFVHVYGDVDMINEGEFRDSILRASTAQRPVIVDLTKCTFICSRGLHVLFELRDLQEKGALSVVAPSHIARLFNIVGLPEMVDVRDGAPQVTA